MDARDTPEKDTGEILSYLIIRQDERAPRAGLLVRPNRSLSHLGKMGLFAGM